MLQVAGSASAKALRQEQVWRAGGSVPLQLNSQYREGDGERWAGVRPHKDLWATPRSLGEPWKAFGGKG